MTTDPDRARYHTGRSGRRDARSRCGGRGDVGPRAPAGTVSVVTDLGRNYPLSDPELLKVLGYDGVQPVRLPAGLVARLPQGSALTPAAAMRQSAGA